MKPDFGVAVVGCGKWGVNHVRVAHQLVGDRLKLVCDISEESLAHARAVVPSVATTTSFDRILKEESIQAVIIASGAETHLDLGLKCMQAGKHCLIEKPLALRSAEAMKMVETAERNNVTLMVGHLLRYHPAVNRIRLELLSGNLGQMLYLYSQRVNLGTIRREENAFWSLAPHDISVMLFLTNQMPLSVSAMGGNFISKNLPDVVFFNLEFENGVVAHGHVSWLDPHKIRKFTIVGSRKMIVFDDMETVGKLRIFDKGVGIEDGDILSLNGDSDASIQGSELMIRDGDIYIPRLPTTEPLKIEQQHFYSCLQEGKRPLTDGKNGIAVLKVMEAAQESLDNGGAPVKIQRETYA